MSDDLRVKMEVQLVKVEGELSSALTGLGEAGWQIVQLLPQPDGSLVALVQRRKLLIETDTSTLRALKMVKD